jgi:hypothetical protein
LGAALVGADDQHGGLSGSAVDPTGAPLTATRIRAYSPATDPPYETYTDRQGQFHLGDLSPGLYKLTFTLNGFLEKTIPEVWLSAGENTNVGVVHLDFASCNTPGGPICDDFGLSKSRTAQNAGGPRVLAYPDLRCRTGTAFIIETQRLRGKTAARSLVLWMCDPQKHEDEIVDNVYTCPDQTRGHFYRGQTRLSVIDEKTKRVLNTIPILSDWENETTFDIPYRIARYFYAVNDHVDRYGEGKPRILSLKDHNGDGDALEFAVFEADSCTIVKTSLFGYSKASDRVLQYPIRLIHREGTTVTVRDSPWLDHFMLQKPVSPGRWKWQQQYHVGGLTHFDIRYDPATEAFDGDVITDPER